MDNRHIHLEWNRKTSKYAQEHRQKHKKYQINNALNNWMNKNFKNLANMTRKQYTTAHEDQHDKEAVYNCTWKPTWQGSSIQLHMKTNMTRKQYTTAHEDQQEFQN